MKRSLAAVALCTGALALAACSDDDPIRSGSIGSADEATMPSASAEPTEPAEPPTDDGPTGDLDVALSEPREDSLYPDVGDPGVDALHYDLALGWSPDTDTLEATETMTFRSTETDDSFQLDFSEVLEIDLLTVDGADVEFEQRGKDLVIQAPVREDQRYEVVIDYSGTPEPVDVPTQRSDFGETGFTITDDHEVWTMQEPWGAYSWYAVNDHPSDKALYDFTLSVPAPWMGIANGDLVSTEESDGQTVTRWHLAEPAASYLTTLAFGDYEQTELTGPRDIPIRLFTPRDEPDAVQGPSTAPEAMEWLEQYVGPYPFDTFGIVVVDSSSGMETQTMVTLGNSDYTLSLPVVVHELAHQWYGDTVTPDDWRDVWMNEGMAMYLQGMWEAERAGIPVDEQMDQWAEFEDGEREFAGPPADYDLDKWGSGNIYYGPALMWHELRQQIGDEKFFEVIRAWPESQENRSANRETLYQFFEKQTGEELSEFFDAWLLGEATPPRD
jgi:aminopeptidase N